MKKTWLVATAAVLTLASPTLAFAACCGCKAVASPTQNICIQTTKDCATLKDQTTNVSIKALSDCTTVLSETQCKPVDKGVCVTGPTDEATYSAPAATATTSETTIPGGLKPNIPIPGLTFSDTLVKQGDKLIVPYLAQYISAIQRYMVGIAITAAAVMIVYGGFLYIMSSSGAGVSTGKDVLRNAVIGLLLVLGSVTILTVINPSVVNLEAIQITDIKPYVQRLDTRTSQGMGALAGSEFTPDPDTVAALKGIKGKKPPPTRMRPDDPFDTREVLDAGEISQVAAYVAKKAGIEDTCIVKAMMGIESGNAINAIGHDEDAPLFQVQARLDYLRSGKKFSKETFEPPSDLPANCDASCQPIVTRTRDNRNDDTVITATPPDFGLDWRFSHGIGLTQLTIFPKRGCQGKNGEWGLKHPATGNTCWTTPVLLTLEGTIDLTIAAMKTMREKGASQPCDFFNGWAGAAAKGACLELVQNKKQAYDRCRISG